MDKYFEILELPHHESRSRARMSLEDRAAQFAPYAALSGYDTVVRETARITSERITLDESEIERIDGVISEIDALGAAVAVKITYFIADKYKSGGEYVTVCGEIGRVDRYSTTVIMTDGREIQMSDIIDISVVDN